MTRCHVTKSQFDKANQEFKAIKKISSGHYIEKCATAFKMVYEYLKQQHLESGATKGFKHRSNKYNKELSLRFVFDKNGVSFYSEFPKDLNIKNRKLGTYPQMTFEAAVEKVKLIRDTKGEAQKGVQTAFDLYENSLKARVGTFSAYFGLSDHSFRSYPIT